MWKNVEVQFSTIESARLDCQRQLYCLGRHFGLSRLTSAFVCVESKWINLHLVVLDLGTIAVNWLLLPALCTLDKRQSLGPGCTATRCSRFRGIPLQIEMGFLNKVWKGSANKLKVGTMRGADRHTRVRRRAPCRAMESGTMRQGERERVLRAETWVRHRKRPSPNIATIECTWSVHVVCKGAHQLYTAIDV